MLASIRFRLLLIVVALALPLCFFAYSLFEQVDKQVAFTRQEMQGLTLQAPLVALYAALAEEKSDVAPMLREVRQAYASVGERTGFTGQPLPAATAQALGFEGSASWHALLGALEAAAAAAQQRERALAITRVMIQRVTDGSNLTLDPDLDSYYLMDMLSFALPGALETLSRAQARLAAVDSPERTAALQVDAHVLGVLDAGRAEASLNTALAEDANFYGSDPTIGRLTPLMQAALADLQAVSGLLKDGAQQLPGESPQAAFTQARGSLLALYRAGTQELQELLQARLDSFAAERRLLMIQGSVSLAVGLLLFVLISQSIVGPLLRLVRVMGALAQGDVGVEIPGTRKRDELGRMARAVVVFKDNAVALRAMANDFEQSVGSVVEIVASAATQLDAASRGLTSQAQESSQRLQHLTDDVGSVSGSMQTVASASEELYQAIHEICTQVERSSVTAQHAAQEAQQVQQTADQLAVCAEKIDGIIGIITGIASKITLLSLNATIEAARAGESGKGFAVVADEIKALANQTARATDEISQLVASIKTSSHNTLGAVGQIAQVVHQLKEIAGTIAAAVQQQSAATQHITANIQQASVRVESVTLNVAQVSMSAQQSSAAAEQTLHASGDLSRQSEALRSQVSQFMTGLRKSA